MTAPEVSILLPARNEEAYIASCLDSILANDFPHDRLEVLVLDGMSSDGTREIVRAYSERNPFIRLLDNHGRVVPTGLNIGIHEARGEIIVRMDAHTLYAPDYIRRCVELLRTTGAANVGGLQRSVGTTYLARAIALATATPFGAGKTRIIVTATGSSVGWTPSISELGSSQPSNRSGGFNEEWVVNQDYELNCRIRAAGGKILLAPDIVCWYRVRDSWKKLAIQYFRYGMWRVKTLRANPDSLQIRQLAAPVFVLGLAGSAVAGLVERTTAGRDHFGQCSPSLRPTTPRTAN
jgi:succinoglycan biosynthesis protein ExoA